MRRTKRAKILLGYSKKLNDFLQCTFKIEEILQSQLNGTIPLAPGLRGCGQGWATATLVCNFVSRRNPILRPAKIFFDLLRINHYYRPDDHYEPHNRHFTYVYSERLIQRKDTSRRFARGATLVAA